MRKTILFSMAISVACGLLLISGTSQADNDADIKAVRAELQKMIPAADSAEIVAAPAKGVYRIDLNGSFAYAYVDGNYVLFGDLYDTERQVNLGQQARGERMAKVISGVPVNKMIVFGPENPKRYITVFTDIDCGYCRKLHNEVPDLTEAGIQVRYLAFPRSGIGRESYDKYVSVWCSDDQQAALTSAKAGGIPKKQSCQNPIAETYRLGQQIGVTGTPTIIFDDGTITPGYIPAATLITRLGLDG